VPSDETGEDLEAHPRLPLGTPPAPRGRLEWAGWLLAGAVVAGVMTWPLVLHLRTHIPQDLGDPLGQAWFLAWGGHALLHAPLHLFQGNIFWPGTSSYAYSDSLLGWFPAGWIGAGPVAAVARYDLVFLLSYALAFMSAGLLARELGCRPAAAAVCAFGYAWAPWKMTHNGHLNVLSTAGVALTLFLLLSGYRRCRPRQVVAGWAAAAWQMTIGFALGIWFAYLLAVLAALCAVAWLRHGRPRLPRWLVVSTAIGGVLYLAVTAFMVRPYADIVARDPTALRDRAQVQFFSAPPSSVLAAADDNRLWRQATKSVRDKLPWAPEQALFPGLTVVLLAVGGLTWRGATRGLRVGLAIGTTATVLLSFGLRLWGGRLYAPLLDHAPGWQGIRTTGRLAFLWSLGLAVLAGMGAERLFDALARRPTADARALVPAQVAVAGVAVLALLVGFEGAPRLAVLPVPVEPVALHDLPGPQLHLPSDSLNDTPYMLWSTDGFPKVANGSASYTPKALELLRQQTAAFPDAGSIALLRGEGFRTVVVHRDRIPGTPWAAAADKPVDGLGISRRDDGAVVVFDLGG
jgi:hypothetical protein